MFVIPFSIELFEGSTQSNSSVFSSLSSSTVLSPLVERQSFILGGNAAHVAALKVSPGTRQPPLPFLTITMSFRTR